MVSKAKCEELEVSKSCASSMVNIEKLDKEIKTKYKIINDPHVSLENLAHYPNKNAVIDNTVTSSSLLETLDQINQTGNSLEKRKGIDFEKEFIKSHSNKEKNDKNNNNSNISITSVKSQLELVSKDNRGYLKQTCSEYKSEEKNNEVNNGETPCNFKHAWLAGTCFIVADSILTGTNENRLTRNNRVVKVQDFTGGTIDDLKYHVV